MGGNQDFTVKPRYVKMCLLRVADEEVEERNRREEKKNRQAGYTKKKRFRHDSTGAEITAPVQTDVFTTASCLRLTNTLS